MASLFVSLTNAQVFDGVNGYSNPPKKLAFYLNRAVVSDFDARQALCAGYTIFRAAGTTVRIKKPYVESVSAIQAAIQTDERCLTLNGDVPDEKVS